MSFWAFGICVHKYSGEIDTCSQFHPHLTSSFFRQYPFAKKSQNQTVMREKLYFCAIGILHLKNVDEIDT